MHGLDTPPHRPIMKRAQDSLLQQADATFVAPSTSPPANVLRLLLALRQRHVAPAVETATGKGFADTLAALAGAMPKKVAAQDYGDRGDWFPDSSKYGPDRGTLAILPPNVGYYSKGERRGTMAHEFGHVLEESQPDLFEEFLKRNPNFPPGAFRSETFADAFSTAVSKHVGGIESPRQYLSSKDLINARQQMLLDSLVQHRMKQLPQ
jgi:hypothetical protein